jgi:hypothetical protein
LETTVVEAESEKAVGHAIFGNIALHATDVNTRPTNKSLYLMPDTEE